MTPTIAETVGRLEAIGDELQFAGARLGALGSKIEAVRAALLEASIEVSDLAARIRGGPPPEE